jgi:hypothetical protein
MPSSGMLRRVAHVRTDSSEGPITSIIRMTRIGQRGTKLAVTSNRRTGIEPGTSGFAVKLVALDEVVPSSLILSSLTM